MEETRKSTQLKAGEMILLAVFAAVIVGVLALTAVGALMPEQKPEEAPEMSAAQMAEAGDAVLLDYWSAEEEQTDNGTEEEPQSAEENAALPEQDAVPVPVIPEQEIPETPVPQPERETYNDNGSGSAEVVDTQSRVEWTEGWD